jgi:hypothetical protein
MSLVALALGLVGGLLILPLGLILDERLSWLLVLAVAALFAALGVTWAGFVLGRTDDGIPLTPVLTAVELAALALWLVRLSPIGSMLARVLQTNLAYVATCVVILALAAVLAAAHFRGGRRDLSSPLRPTLSLLAAVLIGVPAVVYVASLFGLVGA